MQVIVLDRPERINERFGSSYFVAGYIGYYLCNNAVIAQKFSDRDADERARKILEETFPDRAVEQIAIDGNTHCTTQQEIKI